MKKISNHHMSIRSLPTLLMSGIFLWLASACAPGYYSYSSPDAGYFSYEAPHGHHHYSKKEYKKYKKHMKKMMKKRHKHHHHDD
ncbi:MAG: hypothetical protein K2J49_08310 [Muribaculaceae bacterium]|nr:hypothetical protein [Muribaculaceae bacterium]